MSNVTNSLQQPTAIHTLPVEYTTGSFLRSNEDEVAVYYGASKGQPIKLTNTVSGEFAVAMSIAQRTRGVSQSDIGLPRFLIRHLGYEPAKPGLSLPVGSLRVDVATDADIQRYYASHPRLHVRMTWQGYRRADRYAKWGLVLGLLGFATGLVGFLTS